MQLADIYSRYMSAGSPGMFGNFAMGTGGVPEVHWNRMFADSIGPMTPNAAPAATGGPMQPQANAAPLTQTPIPTATPAPTTPATPAAPSLDQLRTQFMNEASQKFGTNYGRTLIGNNFLDGAIDNILNEQRGSAQQYLDRGKARGIYNDKGYGAGLNKINTSADIARSSLSSLGTGVLDKYRTQANTVRDRAFGGISGMMPGQTFSLDPYLAEGNQIKDEASRNAVGDLRGALGGTNYFDFSGIGNSAGMAQGAQNLRDADVATALAERKRKASAGRGLGSQGSF
jgi:hypothetical protein